MFGGVDFARTVEMMHRLYGDPPRDKLTASVHEAGHATVSLALGGTLTECYVKDTPDGWVGYADAPIPGVTGDAINIRAEPERARKIAIRTIAGVAAEMVMGCGHPASSTEEQFEVAAIATALVGKDQAEAWVNKRLNEAAEILRENTLLFATIADALYTEDRATAEVADKLGITADEGRVRADELGLPNAGPVIHTLQ